MDSAFGNVEDTVSGHDPMLFRAFYQSKCVLRRAGVHPVSNGVIYVSALDEFVAVSLPLSASLMDCLRIFMLVAL
jgi:hypothetical protein